MTESRLSLLRLTNSDRVFETSRTFPNDLKDEQSHPAAPTTTTRSEQHDWREGSSRPRKTKSMTAIRRGVDERMTMNLEKHVGQTAQLRREFLTRPHRCKAGLGDTPECKADPPSLREIGQAKRSRQEGCDCPLSYAVRMKEACHRWRPLLLFQWKITSSN